VNHIGSHKVFAHLDRLEAWRRGERPAPVTVEIDLTNVCSLGCLYCHFRHTHVAGPWANKAAKPIDYADTGRLADTERFCAIFRELKAAGAEGVVFTGGGEPTLHPDFDRLVSEAHAAGLQLGMYTLGGHISEARAQLLKTIFTWVVVSLDAADATTYSAEKHVPTFRFDDACSGVKRLAGGACTVGVSFLLHADNWQQSETMLALSRELGASYTTFRPTILTDDAHLSQMVGDRDWVSQAWYLLNHLKLHPDVEIDPPRFLEYMQWTKHPYTTCYGIRLVTQITPDGRVWICPNRRGIAGSELGNLHQESFDAIWARHPGQWTNFAECRAMCRLHLVNKTLDVVHAPMTHEAFV
jgi:MoaA/NifB/PqqE/SkfB family radical SAM enzyme